MSANNVSSLPRPTFLPGFHFVPRCRARMFPPNTCSPPNFFKPKRCECESRPFRDEPTPFLCAIALTPNDECGMMNDELSTICHSSFITLHSSLTNRINLHCRIALPVALFALVLFAPLLFEDDHFVAAPVFDHCAGDARACKSLRTGACAVVAVDCEHFKLHCLAGLLVERRHAQACARFDAKLFAARANDCVSHLFHSSDA